MVPGANAQSSDQDLVQSYWSSFSDGDPLTDVQSVLDGSDPLLVSTTLGGHDYTLFWTEGTQTFEMVVDGEFLVDDLFTFEDEGLRPSFLGLFDDAGAPLVSGFADLNPDGFLVIQLAVPETPTIRMQVVDGEVVSATKCVCFGTASSKKSCSDSDCDTSVDCNAGTSGSAYCRWKYAALIISATGDDF